MYWRKFVVVILSLGLLAIAACQSELATPTLQPGEIEIPFETVAMNESGATPITTDAQTYVIDTSAEIDQLQPLITVEDFKLIQQTDFSVFGIIGLFRVPGRGCDMVGVGIDRLIFENDSLQIYATDWEPPDGGACAETNMSAYHLVKVHKSNLQLNSVMVSLHIERKARK